jgi:hypothetical protein
MTDKQVTDDEAPIVSPEWNALMDNRLLCKEIEQLRKECDELRDNLELAIAQVKTWRDAYHSLEMATQAIAQMEREKRGDKGNPQ